MPDVASAAGFTLRRQRRQAHSGAYQRPILQRPMPTVVTVMISVVVTQIVPMVRSHAGAQIPVVMIPARQKSREFVAEKTVQHDPAGVKRAGINRGHERFRLTGCASATGFP